MANLTNAQKKEWAASLYLKDHLTQGEISDKVGISRVTIGKWIKNERWEERKAAITTTREEQIGNMYRQVAEINKLINAREDGNRFATPKEADIISKLSQAIKKMETDVGISDIISVGTRYINFLRNFDLEKAKETSALFDAFIKDNL